MPSPIWSRAQTGLYEGSLLRVPFLSKEPLKPSVSHHPSSLKALESDFADINFKSQLYQISRLNIAATLDGTCHGMGWDGAIDSAEKTPNPMQEHTPGSCYMIYYCDAVFRGCPLKCGWICMATAGGHSPLPSVSRLMKPKTQWRETQTAVTQWTQQMARAAKN